MIGFIVILGGLAGFLIIAKNPVEKCQEWYYDLRDKPNPNKNALENAIHRF